MNESTKISIRKIVKYYKRLFPDEYNLAIKQIEYNRRDQINKFASIKGNDFVERALTEIPETLSTMFTIRLTDFQMKEFREKRSVHWFAGEFPQFKLAEKI